MTTTAQAVRLRQPNRPAVGDWADPGFFIEGGRARNAARLAKQLIKPPRGHRTIPTRTGLLLITLSLAIGFGAYNTASNILFITLSFLLGSLILSGLLSWWNYKGTRWRLHVQPHLRVGEPAPVRIELSNDKKRLPVYALSFVLRAFPFALPADADATGKNAESGSSKAARKRARKKLDGDIPEDDGTLGEPVTKEVHLESRVEPQTTSTLEWLYEPQSRGLHTVALASLESQYPFGFLRKSIADSLRQTAPVWPARTDYTFAPLSGQRSHRQGATFRKRGTGIELINLRPYVQGDPLRQVHWKASARTGKLTVREMAEENQDTYFLHIHTPAGLWSKGEQFEKLCSVAGSLAEDLHRRDQLHATAVNDQPVQMIRRLADLHAFLGALATVEPVKNAGGVNQGNGWPVIHFQPASAGRIAILINGHQEGLG